MTFSCTAASLHLQKFWIISIESIVSMALARRFEWPDGAKLALEARQPNSTMNVTSVDVGTDRTTITASGKMGAYGKVYTTYNLTYGADRSSGFVEGTGRGVVDAETVVSG